MLRFFFVLFFSISLLSGCKSDQPKQVNIENLAKERPGQIKILFQNDFVLVTKMTLKPGDALPVHRETNRILLAENDCELEIVEGGKKPIRKQFSKDEFAWYEAMVHSVRNPGTTNIEMYVISRKQTPLPAEEQIQENTIKPINARVLLKNDQVIVREVFLGAGKNLVSQSGYQRLTYAMNEYQMQHTDAAGTTQTLLYRSGQFHWHNSGQYQLENVGDTDARFLVVEFLK